MGAAGGYLTYWLGALLAGYPDLAGQSRPELAQTFLRPFTTFTSWEVALVTFGATLGAALARYRWRVAGLLSYVGLLSIVIGYLAYSITVSIPMVPASHRWISWVLLGAEAAGLTLFCVFSFYTLDAATRRFWKRIPHPDSPPLEDPPHVAFEVPVFNEPLDMVRQTIAHLLRQDYPRDRFQVIVADDSTDPEARQALEDFCRSVGATYFHRPQRTGYKAGALNHVTRGLPPEVEFVAIVDADYWVAPDYLTSLVGYLQDPRLAFVQTPQDYRNVDDSFLSRQYKRAESYFYHAIMPSRNEENAIIFCGTMGILRRAALEEVGGFSEDQICEDAEVSVRLAARGWKSLYVNQSFGRGLAPAVFDVYKKQFHRWAFGNVRILLSRLGLILRSPMSRRQKFDFIVSNLHWFDGYFVVAISLVLLYLGLSPLFGYDAVTHHQREIALLGLIPLILLVDSLARLLVVLRRSGRVRLRDSFLVQGMWFAIKMTNLRAVTKSLLGLRTPFIRTPKAPGQRLGRWAALGRTVRITWLETLLGLLLLGAAAAHAFLAPASAGVAAGRLLAAWLVLFAIFFLCAPAYAYLSYRTLQPSEHPGIPLPEPVVRPPDGPVPWTAAPTLQAQRDGPPS